MSRMEDIELAKIYGEDIEKAERGETVPIEIDDVDELFVPTEELNNILNQIPEENFKKMITYVENHYSDEAYEFDNQALIDFFETNYSTGIWYNALKNSISESDYNKIIDLESQDWEMADFIGSLIGRYVVKNHIKNL